MARHENRGMHAAHHGPSTMTIGELKKQICDNGDLLFNGPDMISDDLNCHNAASYFADAGYSDVHLLSSDDNFVLLRKYDINPRSNNKRSQHNTYHTYYIEYIPEQSISEFKKKIADELFSDCTESSKLFDYDGNIYDDNKTLQESGIHIGTIMIVKTDGEN